MQSLAVDGSNGADNGRLTAVYHKHQHNVPSKIEKDEREENIEELDEDDDFEEQDDDDDDEEEEEENKEKNSNLSPEVADQGISSSSEIVIPFSWYKDQLSRPVYAHQTFTQLQQNEPNIAETIHSNSQMNDEANEPSEPT